MFIESSLLVSGESRGEVLRIYSACYYCLAVTTLFYGAPHFESISASPVKVAQHSQQLLKLVQGRVRNAVTGLTRLLIINQGPERVIPKTDKN